MAGRRSFPTAVHGRARLGFQMRVLVGDALLAGAVGAVQPIEQGLLERDAGVVVVVKLGPDAVRGQPHIPAVADAVDEREVLVRELADADASDHVPDSIARSR